jgi:hypothetical protein
MPDRGFHGYACFGFGELLFVFKVIFVILPLEYFFSGFCIYGVFF